MCKLPSSCEPVPVRAEGGREDDAGASIEFVVRNTFITPVALKSDRLALRRVKSEPALLESRPVQKVSICKLPANATCDAFQGESQRKDKAQKELEGAELLRRAADLRAQYQATEEAAQRTRQAAKAAKLNEQAREAEEAAEKSRHAARLWTQAREAEEAAQRRSLELSKLRSQTQEVEEAAQRVRQAQKKMDSLAHMLRTMPMHAPVAANNLVFSCTAPACSDRTPNLGGNHGWPLHDCTTACSLPINVF